MCSFDADPCDFFRQTFHTARTPKKCEVCCWEIPEGAPYQKTASSFDGGFASTIACFGCAWLMERFHEAHRGGPTPDWFLDALRDCVEVPRGFFKDSDVREWRDAIAAILWRGLRRELVTQRLKSKRDRLPPPGGNRSEASPS